VQLGLQGAQQLLGRAHQHAVRAARLVQAERHLGGVGQVVGHLVRDLVSGHIRQITNPDGAPLGDPVCFNNYAESDVVPVTVFEP